MLAQLCVNSAKRGEGGRITHRGRLLIVFREARLGRRSFRFLRGFLITLAEKGGEEKLVGKENDASMKKGGRKALTFLKT